MNVNQWPGSQLSKESRQAACEAADDHHETQVQALADCETVDDLKNFIADYLMNS